MNIILAKPTISPDELLALPEGDRFELIDDHLVEKEVSALSGLVEGILLGKVFAHCERHQLGFVWPGTTGIQCFAEQPTKIRRPDLSFIKRERFTPALLATGFLRIAPDLAAEVISPGDLATEVQQKIEEYWRAGVSLIWVIEPTVRVVDVYRQNGSTTRLRETDELSGEDVLPGFRCRVVDLFPPRLVGEAT